MPPKQQPPKEAPAKKGIHQKASPGGQAPVKEPKKTPKAKAGPGEGLGKIFFMCVKIIVQITVSFGYVKYHL